MLQNDQFKRQKLKSIDHRAAKAIDLYNPYNTENNRELNDVFQVYHLNGIRESYYFIGQLYFLLLIDEIGKEESK